MNLADAAELILLLSLKDEVSSGLKGIQGALDKTNTKSASLSGGLSKIGQGLGTGVKNAAKIGIVGLGALWTQVDAGIESLVELEDVTNQTNAVLKSTGGAAGLTAEEVRALAQEYEELSGVDDKVVQSAENVLLTFTNVKEDAFEPALAAALDMSQALDQDLQSSIVQIGKALNDPEKGLSALSRVGVTFDEETKKIIADMVAVGDTAGAQQLIIAELNKEFGGSAQASMEGYRGVQLRIKDTWEDLQMTLAEAVLPALDKLGRKLNETLKDPEIKEGVRKLGQAIAGLFSDENIKTGSDALKGVFTFLKELPWDTIKQGLSFAAENAKKVVDVFRSLPPGVQAGLLTFLAANKLTGGLVASGIGELLKVGLSSLKTITAGNVTLVASSVSGPGGGAPGSPGGGGKMALLGSVTIAGAAAMFIDQIGQEQAQALRDYGPLRPSDAQALQMTGLAPILSQANSSIAQLGFNFLGPGFRSAADQIGAFADQSFGFDQRAQTAAAVRNQLILATNMKMAELKAAQGQQTQVITGFGADHRDELRRIHAQAVEQKNNLQRGNLIASEARERLGSIQISAQRTAQKDLSVTVHANTNVYMNAQKIAAAVEHYKKVSGNKPLDGGQ